MDRKNGRFSLVNLGLRLKFAWDVVWIWLVFYWRNMLTYRHYLPAGVRRVVERLGGEEMAEFELVWDLMSDAERERFLVGSKKAGSLSVWRMMVRKYKDEDSR